MIQGKITKANHSRVKKEDGTLSYPSSGNTTVDGNKDIDLRVSPSSNGANQPDTQALCKCGHDKQNHYPDDGITKCVYCKCSRFITQAPQTKLVSSKERPVVSDYSSNGKGLENKDKTGEINNQLLKPTNPSEISSCGFFPQRIEELEKDFAKHKKICGFERCWVCDSIKATIEEDKRCQAEVQKILNEFEVTECCCTTFNPRCNIHFEIEKLKFRLFGGEK